MHYQFILPSPALAPFVKHYWVLETGTDEIGMTERVIPTTSIQLMFHYKTPFRVDVPGYAFSVEQPVSFVSGLSSSYIDATTRGASGVIAVVFHSYSASCFFRFPLRELEERIIALDDVYANQVNFISEQLSDCDAITLRIKIIERFLLSIINTKNADKCRLVENAIHLIELSGGQMMVGELARTLNLSEKSLERKFPELVGKSTKQFIRTVRFNKVLRALALGNAAYLTEYAYNNGYYDQAHFIKEFKTFSGYTPREFISRFPCQAEWIENELG